MVIGFHSIGAIYIYISPIDLNHKTPKISPWAYIFQRAFWWAYIRGLRAATSYPGFFAFLILGYRTSPSFDIRKARNPAGEVVSIGLYIFIHTYKCSCMQCLDSL